ncbi:MAG: 50S ribosomal protein L22 [Candidatus Omnitrophica bacterium]|nr:50S ribosomal protein L22 [Candidatus Omnitrophota bacterium]
MLAKAKARHIRISAQKVRLVLDLIRRKPANTALSILGNTHKRAAEPVSKLLRSAIANAKNKGIAEDGLFISKICADEGVTWKRFMANAFGRGSRIFKRTSHITIELDKKEVAPKAVQPPGKKVTKKAEKPVKAKKEAKPAVNKTAKK